MANKNFMEWGKGMAWCKYEVVDLENGQRMEGFPAELAKLIGIPKTSISYHAREGVIYKKKYRFQKVLEGQEDPRKKELSNQWDRIHQIYLELVAGERCIKKAADGKRYAIKVK